MGKEKEWGGIGDGRRIKRISERKEKGKEEL
jgi:hypothetical protein